jgi:hypothetical protein
VADVLKGLTGATSVFLFAWIFPAALAVGAVAFFLMPWLTWVPHEWQFSKMDWTKATILLAFIGVALGLLMSGLETLLYRILEGYVWPPRLRAWGVERQRARRQRLEERRVELRSEAQRRRQNNQPYIGWEETLVEERLKQFPVNDNDLAPSRLGNAIRSFETYGWNHFNLDSQSLWTELLTVVPDALRKELDQSRAAVDFLVSLVYLSLAYGVVALSGLLGRGDLSWTLLANNWDFVATAAVAFVLARVWYRAAVSGSSYWFSTVQALVDVGRLELAEAMGLQMPATVQEERQMWEAVSNFVVYPYDQGAAQALNPFRKVPDASGSTSSSPPGRTFLDWLIGR